MRTLATRAFVGGSLAWAAVLPLATFAAARPQPSSVVYLFALMVYVTGGAVCHQIDARSFHLWGRQMPVCARCTGIYLGAAAALIVTVLARRRRTTASQGPHLTYHPRVVLAVAALPVAATLVYEWWTGTAPANLTRAASGVVLGAAVALLVVKAGEAPAERTTL